MTTKELERQKDSDTVPEKKTAQPQKWQVVMHYGAPEKLGCCICLLRHVFNLNSIQATKHVDNALQSGKDIILQSTHDVVETKVLEAQDARDRRAVLCSRAMINVDFTSEPA